MKKTVLFSAAILIFTACFMQAAQPNKPDYILNDTRILEKARNAFESGDYGNALKLADSSKIARKKQVEWEIFTLQNSLKPVEVRHAGDSISDILPVLEKRQDYEALGIINRYEKKYPSKIENSSKKLLEYIRNKKEFPEADYLIGEIYRIEGEYDIAEKCLLTAWTNAANLDIPDEQYDILYSMAAISLVKKDMRSYESNLLNVVAQDSNYTDENKLNSMMMLIRKGEAGGVEKFFKMYRSDCYKAINAYSALSEYYEDAGDKDKALKTGTLCVLTGFTKMYNIVKQRNPDFEYTDLSSFIQQVSTYTDINEWGIKNNVWRSFNFFADMTYNEGDIQFSKELYTVISESSPEKYWKDEATIALKKFEN